MTVKTVGMVRLLECQMGTYGWNEEPLYVTQCLYSQYIIAMSIQ